MKKTLNSFASGIEKFLNPFAKKVASSKHLQVMSAAFMSILPLIMIGSFALIISNPFIDYTTLDSGSFFYTIFKGWFDFSQSFGQHINFLFGITLGSQSLYIALAIAYVSAKRTNMNIMNSMVVVFVSFLLVNSGYVDWNLSTAYFGGTGLFSSVIIAFIAVDIYHYLIKNEVGFIRFPDSVPSILSESIGQLVPMALVLTVMVVIRFLFNDIIMIPFPELILSVGSRLNVAVDSIFGISIVSSLSQLAWWFGIHSSSFLSIVTPSLEANMLENMNAFALGVPLAELPRIVNTTFYYTYIAIGGGGATFSLVLLMIRSKSDQIKAIGKLSLIPGIFGINEPVLFGLPVVLNPVFLIPFLLTHIVNIILTYFAMSWGLVNKIVMSLSAQTPIGVSHVLANLDFRSLILLALIIIIDMIIYYPFFKMFEKEKLEEEKVNLEAA